MELSGKGQSLKIFFLKYLVSIAVGLIVAIVAVISSFNLFYNSGLVLPANYTENIILKNKEKIAETKNLDLSLIPDRASYVLLSEKGAVVNSNMSEANLKKAIDFHKGNKMSTFLQSFMEIRRPDGYLVIEYVVRPHYTNNWMEKNLPDINIMYSAIMVAACFINSIIITVFWAGRLTRQLQPMIEASEEISKQNLDFEIGKSRVKEFNEVLKAMDKMKSDLKKSLVKNWLQEENRRNQISALTHDLKTPISVVQGNSELLKLTNLTEEQEVYVNFIIKNSKRISEYTKALMVMNKSTDVNSVDMKDIKVEEISKRVCDISEEIASVNNLSISRDIKIEDKSVKGDIALIERVIQNIISNAVEYSGKKKEIKIELKTTEKYFEIRVKDRGKGFSNKDLIHGTEQFYRGDKSRHSPVNYGLGLYIAKEIADIHKGHLILKNRDDDTGAEVIIQLPLA